MGFWDIITGGFANKTQRLQMEKSGLNIEGLDSSKIGIFQPITFYDITQFVKRMSKKVPLIVNFMGLKPSEAERSLDFVCGAVCALNGKFEKIGEGIYFFAPPNMTLDMDKNYKRT